VQHLAPLSPEHRAPAARTIGYSWGMKANVSRTPSGAEPAPNFRERLRAELVRRCGANPQYSLRAFALDLDSDHATLSQLLRGRRSITAATIERLGPRIGLTADEIASCVRREKSAPAETPEDATVLELRTLSQYAAAVVTEWEHYAILELTHVNGFRPDIGWIARVLGLTPDAVTLAVNRLLYLGMLSMVDEHTWIDHSGDVVALAAPATPHAFHAAALHALVERLATLAPAQDAHGGALPQDHSSTTLAVSVKRLPEVIERLHALRRELVLLLESDESRDEVYRLDTHLFPVTRCLPRS
jgi:uncharacterized protein (TIGR02147 family)